MRGVDWNLFEKAFQEARKTFMPRENVLGVRYGPREVNGKDNIEEPAIIILVREQPATPPVSHGKPFPEDMHGFPIIVREPYVKRDEDKQKSNRSHSDLSWIDGGKVDRMHQGVQRAIPPASSLSHATFGQVFVIQDSPTDQNDQSALVYNNAPGAKGGYLLINWPAAYRCFRATWGDDYDFIAMYVDIPSGMPSLNNHHKIIFNNVTGINNPWPDVRTDYGSPTRLLGLQVMPKDQHSLTKNGALDKFRDFATKGIRLHELGHQWGSYVRLGTLSNLDSHWEFTFDSDLSPLAQEPNDWQPDSSNTHFTEMSVDPDAAAYCPLDLYLMGMIPESDPRLANHNLYYLNSLTPNVLVTAGTSHTGSPSYLSVPTRQVNTTPRSPDAARSPRSFRQAFVLLTKNLNFSRTIPNVGAALADIIDYERKVHADQFRETTESRAVLDTYLYSDPYDDIYIRDNQADTGTEPSTGPFWNSPDIWVHSTPSGSTHQDTIRGQTNYVSVRVWNKGTQNSGEITVNLYRANFAGSEFQYPEDWRLEDRIDKSQTTPSVPAGSNVVLTFTWDPSMIPSATWHPCLLAEVLPIHRTQTNLRNVWQDRRIAQKNISIVSLTSPSKSIAFPFSIGSRSQPARWARVRIQQKEGVSVAEVALDLGLEDWLARLTKVGPLEGMLLDIGNNRTTFLTRLSRNGTVSEREGRPFFVLSDVRHGGDIALPLLEAERRELTLRISFGDGAPAGDTQFEITQLDVHSKIVGGLELILRKQPD